MEAKRSKEKSVRCVDILAQNLLGQSFEPVLQQTESVGKINDSEYKTGSNLKVRCPPGKKTALLIQAIVWLARPVDSNLTDEIHLYVDNDEASNPRVDPSHTICTALSTISNPPFVPPTYRFHVEQLWG